MKTTDREIKNYRIHVVSIFIIRAILWLPAQILLYFLLNMKVFGKENIENLRSGRVIFAANHFGELDPFAFQYTLSFFSKFVPLYFVSLQKNFYTFNKYKLRSFIYGGLFFRMMGAYPVYKGVGDFEKSLKHHIEILLKNHSVLMFPEGSIRKKKDVEIKAKPGIIYLAKRTNSVIVPVSIKGTGELTLKKIFLRKANVSITFGMPIYPDEFTGCAEKLTRDEMVSLSKQVMSKIESL